jgi:hypothetical protein
MVLRREVAFYAVIILLALTISAVALNIDDANAMAVTIRLLALNGYLALSIAAILTPFIKEVTLFFKKSFIRIHHYFAAAGLLLITLHPISVALLFMNARILLPNFSSISDFFFYGGSVALIAIYLAFGAVLLRRKIVVYWRSFHALMYVALFFGVVHANLWGLDFENTAVMVVYDGLFAAALGAFVLKRWQFYQIKQRRNRTVNPQRKPSTSEPQRNA